MKALTIRQPWADDIVYGTKRVENRTWATTYRGPLLIHTAAQHDPYVISSSTGPDVRSAILAVAELTDCHADDGCCGSWGERNVHHWTLAHISPLPEPVPCPGALRLWTPSDTVAAAVTATLTP